MYFSNSTLIKIASLGGIATVSMGLLARWKINDNISKTEYYKSALSAVRKHPGAVNLLGEPIRAGIINVGDQKNNYTKGNIAHYEVPVKGSKQKGVIHFWADKSKNSSWTVTRIELESQNEKDKRLLIKSPCS